MASYQILDDNQIAQLSLYSVFIENIVNLLILVIFSRGLYCCMQPTFSPFNWGAFLFTPIWAIWTKNYKALWSMLPIIGLVFSIYYGFYGNVKKLNHTSDKADS
ncbi:MAG: hypothetical protein HRU38_16245 [Saccharospirillaceae bacterium]|nr:hypothetical protein [Pseudomonadales bacterium]NRB80193.1 hypothetical protein [Saccharospirillaceae bacterium]